MKTFLKLVFPFIIVFLIGSCKKDEDAEPATSGGSTSNQVTAGFCGEVRDNQGNLMAGVLVNVGGVTTSTNSNGFYYIQSATVAGKRAVIEADKAGYWKQQKGIIPQSGTVNLTNLIIYPDNKGYSVNGVAGGTVTMPGGTVVTFPANAFVTQNGAIYSGTVYISGHEILTSENRFAEKIPGGDFLAKDNAGDIQTLLSCGMAGIKLYDASGGELLIAPGKTAELKIPINPLQSGITSSIPLWYYSEIENYWIEEGQATRMGNYFVGNVSHFTWWNCDYPSTNCTATIHITDCSGNPVGNIYFDFNGGSGWGHASATTNANGSETVPLPSNTTFTLNIYDANNFNLDTVITVGPFVAGSNNVINYQTGDCNIIHGTLKDCNNNLINGTVALLLNNVPLSTVATVGGLFSFPLNQPGSYTLVATSGQLTGSDSLFVTTANLGQAVTMTLNLCDTISTAGSNFSLTFSTGSSNLQYALFVSDVKYQTTSTGQQQIVFSYQDTVNNGTGEIVVNIPAYAPGNYVWNSGNSSVSGNLFYASQAASLSTTTGITKLYTSPAVGGLLLGLFNGHAVLQSGPLQIPGYLSATFNTWRTQ